MITELLKAPPNFKKEFDRMCRDAVKKYDRDGFIKTIYDQKRAKELNEYRQRYLEKHLMAGQAEPISSDSTFVKIEDYDESDIN